METFPLKWGLYGDSSLWSLFFFIPLYGDSSLWRLFLFTGTLRGLYGDSSLWRLFLFTPLYGDFTRTLRGLFSMETFPLYGDFTGTLLYGDFSSLLFFTGTLLYGDFSSLLLFTGTLLYGDFSSLRGLYRDFMSNFRSISRRLWIPGVLDAKFLCSGNILLLQTDFITLFLRTAAFRLRG